MSQGVIVGCNHTACGSYRCEGGTVRRPFGTELPDTARPERSHGWCDSAYQLFIYVQRFLHIIVLCHVVFGAVSVLQSAALHVCVILPWPDLLSLCGLTDVSAAPDI